MRATGILKANCFFALKPGWLAVVMLMGTALAASAAAIDLYVLPSATPTSPYDSWATAFDDLPDALSRCIFPVPERSGFVAPAELVKGFHRTAGATSLLMRSNGAMLLLLR